MINYLNVIDKVDVVVLGQSLADPVADDLGEAGVGLKPGGIKAQAEGRAVGAVVPLEVVLKEGLELLVGVDVGTGRDEGAAGEGFIEARVLTTIELVDWDLPNL